MNELTFNQMMWVTKHQKHTTPTKDILEQCGIESYDPEEVD